MDENKRRHPRFVVEGVEGRMGLRAHVELLDLGLGGAAIRSKRELNVGDGYALKFDLGGKSVTINGLIVWSAPGEAGAEPPLYSAGVRFTEALPGELRALVESIGPRRATEERRVAGMRLEFKVPGKALLESGEVYRVRLVSLSGMLIETARPLKREEVYEMEILPPGGEPLAFTGRVRSCLGRADALPPLHEIGIEFMNLSPEARERLNRFVAWLAATV